MLSLEDYRTFLVVARRGGFVRAERELGRTQATISKRILRLERVLGVRLLERGGPRPVAPTPAGRRLLTLIAPLIEAAESIPGQFRRRLAGGVLRLVGDQPALLHELPPAIVPFLQAHPETRIVIRLMAGGALIEALDQNEADLALTVRRTLRDGLTFLPLRNEPIVAVAAPGHSWSDEPLALETLVGSDRIVPDDEEPVQRLLAGACPAWNAEPARLEVADWGLTRAFVAAGGGSGSFPPSHQPPGPNRSRSCRPIRRCRSVRRGSWHARTPCRIPRCANCCR